MLSINNRRVEICIPGRILSVYLDKLYKLMVHYSGDGDFEALLYCCVSEEHYDEFGAELVPKFRRFSSLMDWPLW